TALPILVLPFYVNAQPSFVDPNIQSEAVVSISGQLLTGLVFLSANDMLVTSKNNGHVIRVVNGINQGVVLDLPVNSLSERGLLGIALDPQFNLAAHRYVYLFYTAAPSDGATPTANRVSRFTWNGSALVDEEILINLPVMPGPNHDGGIITFGPPTVPADQQKLFIIIGDLNLNGQMQNNPSGA